MITVYEILKGSEVLKVRKNWRAAMNLVHKLDAEYGASVHYVRKVEYFA